jgi:hypothetical protein
VHKSEIFVQGPGGMSYVGYQAALYWSKTQSNDPYGLGRKIICFMGVMLLPYSRVGRRLSALVHGDLYF